VEFFPDGDQYIIVMEYVEGVELKKIIQQHVGPLPFELGMKIANQSLDAFHYAYQNGVLHRDIKPANILINREENCKLMDFGIAKMSSAASHDTAASMLSVHYVPPERFDRTREVDVRSDIYSLGLVLYEVFAGRRPFNATETSQIMFAHLNEIPEPPNKFSPALPQQISNAISKALEKDPDDRFQNFSEFKQAIQIGQDEFDDATTLMDSDEYLEQTIMLVGTAAPAVEKTGTAAKKSKKGLMATVAALMVIVIAGAIYYFLQPEPLPPIEPTPPAPEGGIKNERGFWEFVHPLDGTKMILIPRGEFTMGSDTYSGEKPVQTITMDEYYIDKYLVTNARFQKFVEATGYQTDAEKAGFGMVRIERRWRKVEGANWRLPDGLTAIDGQEEHPVSQVSYNDALAYCRWAQKDLPTEAQWEKAARGPQGSVFPWGNSEPDNTRANFDRFVGAPTPVTKYEKGQSHYGALDMAGNVYQWCRDWYATGERVGQNPAGPESGKERVIKGGSFIEGMESLRSANRDRYEPTYSSFLFGFRCVTDKFEQ
jgi:formylglycine-generating enzyme required for sulfatase activity